MDDEVVSAVADAEATDEPASEESPAEKISFNDIKEKVVALSRLGKKDDIKDLLQKTFKVKTLPELTEQQYRPLMDELKALEA
jgi:uncharacterized protein YegL